jgi:rSAM/selenodomain-associated transferase 1
MTGSGEVVVALMVRTPIPGRVKTRLIPMLGAMGACQLYQAMVADILANIGACGLSLYLFYDGNEIDLPQAWLEKAVRVWPQRGEDIGERMAAVFTDCFDAGAGSVILVGSDIPALDAAVIDQAAGALASHDAVLVPVADGGYCLIALHRTSFRTELFGDIPWSTSQVLALTQGRLATLNLRAALLPPLRDIDTPADLIAYRSNPAAMASVTNQMIVRLLPI